MDKWIKRLGTVLFFLLLVWFIFILLPSLFKDIETPCRLGWKNDTHFCNEFHIIEKIYNISELENWTVYCDGDCMIQETISFEFQNIVYETDEVICYNNTIKEGWMMCYLKETFRNKGD